MTVGEPYAWLTICAQCGGTFVTDESISDVLDPPTLCGTCEDKDDER